MNALRGDGYQFGEIQASIIAVLLYYCMIICFDMYVLRRTYMYLPYMPYILTYILTYIRKDPGRKHDHDDLMGLIAHHEFNRTFLTHRNRSVDRGQVRF